MIKRFSGSLWTTWDPILMPNTIIFLNNWIIIKVLYLRYISECYVRHRKFSVEFKTVHNGWSFVLLVLFCLKLLISLFVALRINNNWMSLEILWLECSINTTFPIIRILKVTHESFRLTTEFRIEHTKSL